MCAFGNACLHAGDHALEALDLGGKILAARFRPFDAQAELEVFLVADQDIRQRRRSPVKAARSSASRPFQKDAR